MNRIVSIIATGSAIVAAAGLSGCGKKGGEAETNIIEMNASDGSMNDMTVVESSTLDQAGGAAADNASAGGNESNAM